jgi:hypothetical protein
LKNGGTEMSMQNAFVGVSGDLQVLLEQQKWIS